MGNLPTSIPIHALSDTLLSINGQPITLVSERNPANLNWAALDAEYVIECTGKFTKRADALTHVTHAHAKRVIISAPSADAPTYVFGVNSDAYVPDEARRVISCASCTTNCVAPVLKVLNGEVGVEQGFLTTVHAATRSQSVLDGYSRKNRRLGIFPLSFSFL
jgi:glyceraldehyde 3-phosphate dehydrogenase